MDNENKKVLNSIRYFFTCGIFLNFAAVSLLVTSMYMIFGLDITSKVQYVIIAIISLIGVFLYILGDSCENHSWWLYDMYFDTEDLFEDEWDLVDAKMFFG